MCLQYDHDYRVLTGSADKTVKVWDIRRTARSVATIAAHGAAVFALQVSEWVNK